jgi:hypothetical protein
MPSVFWLIIVFMMNGIMLWYQNSIIVLSVQALRQKMSESLRCNKSSIYLKSVLYLLPEFSVNLIWHKFILFSPYFVDLKKRKHPDLLCWYCLKLLTFPRYRGIVCAFSRSQHYSISMVMSSQIHMAPALRLSFHLVNSDELTKSAAIYLSMIST